MYPQSQQPYPYPQQPGFAYPGQPQQAGYPAQAGYPPQAGYPQTGGPSVQLNLGQMPGDSGGGGGFGGLDPTGLFAEKAIRQAFVSKVFSIVTVQLLFTTALIAAFIFNEETRRYFSRTQAGATWLMIGSIAMIVTFLILGCVESARRSTPLNFILLGILTLGYSLVAAIMSCQYSTPVVMGAFLATGISCLVIAAFAKSTSLDITNCGTTLCLLAMAHLVIGIILVIAFPGRTGQLIMAIAGALLVSLYLMFDIQLIMGGRKCEISPEEYVMAAAMLYTDIIQLFIYMLQIINRLSED